MALKRTVKKASRFVVLKATIIIMAVVCAASFVALGSAQGSGSMSTDTLGLGQDQSTQTVQSGETLSSKIVSETTISDKSSSADALKHPTTRTIAVKDPDPVVALAAVDEGNAETLARAAQIGTLTPPHAAPHLPPDTTGFGWKSGLASAYDLDTNQGWDATASGVTLTSQSVTVAVPESQAHLLGSAVEIVYDDKIVVATVTDTGGFEKYGRTLDLAAGVWKAFGFATWDEWGVRVVSYRFL
ncbi:MAG: hypothetical protein RR955_05645 [Raoultibacter sp.]